MTRHIYSFGASVRGPLHRKEGRPNEDAWSHARGAFGVLTVVCDGMGSKPNARTGSRAACAAVREAVSRWSQNDGAPLSYLSHLIEVFWRLRLHPIEPASAASTCLFALATPHGNWVIGGLGDGMALLRSKSELRIIIGERGENFGNETAALGASKGLRAWTLVEVPASDGEQMAVLATDGVADDLQPERLDGFCDWLAETFEPLTPSQRWRRLAAELRDWPTPKHLDDKSLAVIHMLLCTSEETR